MTLLQTEREGNMPRFENRKLEWFIKQGDEDEDPNFFRSLVPYVKQQLPPTKIYF